MNTTVEAKPVSAPWVWSAGEIAARNDWVIRIGADGLRELDAALSRVKARGLALEKIAAGDFPLPAMAGDFQRTKELLAEGPGLCLLRGVPVDKYGHEDNKIILWGLGTHLGKGVAQSYRGDMIGEVMDMSHTGDARRSYRSPRPLDLHIDPVDVVGLLCLRRARQGGSSLITSGFAVHNAILAERPDLMGMLYRGFHYRHSEARDLGGSPTTPHRIPVFGEVGADLVCNFNAAPIGRSLAQDGIETDPAAEEAFEVFKATAAREDLVYEMMLEPGDLQFLNNRRVMHGRTEFQDDEPLDAKRLMYRLWLAMSGWPGLPSNMKLH
jgi:hypothetical protein